MIIDKLIKIPMTYSFSLHTIAKFALIRDKIMHDNEILIKSSFFKIYSMNCIFIDIFSHFLEYFQCIFITISFPF